MSSSTLLQVAAVFAGSLLVAAALGGAEVGHAPWYISRASGIVAFALLSGSVILGLLISTKSPKPIISKPLAFDLHQFLSILGLTFIGVHAGSLLFDGFLHFTPVGVLVPFANSFRPAATGAGIIAAWAAALVTASFWARKRIGYTTWRRFHYLSFAAYLLALVHGITAGTDTSVPFVAWLYILSAAAVASLLVYRIGGAKQPERARRRDVRQDRERAAGGPAVSPARSRPRILE